MKVESVAVESVTLDPSNVRSPSERNLEVIKGSLQSFGQQTPIVVDGDGVVRKGNGTLMAARALGWTHINVVRTELKGAEATAYSIADNRSGDVEVGSGWENELAEVLAGLQMDDSIDHLVTGFTDSEIEELVTASVEPGDGAPNESSGDGPLYSEEQIVDAAFKYYRTLGFPYKNTPLHVAMQDMNALAGLDNQGLQSTNLCYDVADTYNGHRFAASAVGMRSPIDVFGDDKALRKVLVLTIGQGRLGDGWLGKLAIVNGAQACSNFRPGAACAVYREHCPEGGTVLDTSTGYGGRMLGFIASSTSGTYIGIDPNTATHAANVRMAKDLGFSDRVELLNGPAEDVAIESLRGRCDFAFTSPPYFCKELYSDEPTQSCVRYKTADEWRAGFLLPMFRLQFATLRKGSLSIVNIADVNIGKVEVPLVDMAKASAKEAGFAFARCDELRLSRRMGIKSDEVAMEPMLIFERGA